MMRGAQATWTCGGRGDEAEPGEKRARDRADGRSREPMCSAGCGRWEEPVGSGGWREGLVRDFSLESVKVRCVFRTLTAAVEMELDLQGICQGARAVARCGVVTTV